MACQSVTPWKDAPAASTSDGSVVVLSAVICFSSLSRLVKGSRHERPCGSLPAFAWGDVAAPILSITEGRSLSPHSFTRCPIDAPCGQYCSNKKKGGRNPGEGPYLTY